MNKLFTYLLCGLCLASPVLAQTTSPVIIKGPYLPDPTSPAPTPTDPLRAKLDNIFATINKSQVPTGRLFEAAVPLAYLPRFDGTLRDSARTDMDGFRLLLVTAQSARLAGTG